MAEGTRDRILETARKLFNAQGTGPVSTNHIAAAMGISPGNLYYHFRNKEEIIRELVDRWLGRQGPLWREMMETEGSMEHLVDMLRRIYRFGWDLRFYLRELMPLLQADEALRARHREIRDLRQETHTRFLRRLELLGVLQFPGGGRVEENIYRATWLLSHFWVAEHDIAPDEDPGDAIQRAVEMTLLLYGPCLTPPARKALDGVMPGLLPPA
jgi:AcrR family transcriptional regulator